MDMFQLDKSPQEWEKIYKEMQVSGWEEFTLDRQGDLTVWLTHNYRDEYSNNWNRLAKEFRPVVNDYVSKLAKAQSINDDLASYLKWDLIHLYIEEYFNKLKGAPLFYLEYTLELYKNNKVPCGWDGRFPKGCLKHV